MKGKTETGRGILVGIVLLLLWSAASRSGIWSEYLLPSPERVFRTLGKMCLSGELLTGALVSLGRVACGFSLAFTAALLLGVLECLAPSAAAWMNPVIHFLRNIPPLSLISLLILWFGIGEKSKIFLIFLAAFFPMFLNIQKGFAGCDRELLEVGSCFGLSPWQQLRRIRLPYAVPDILVGMQIGLGYSWRAIVGAEMIAAASGLGYLILDAQYMARSDKVIAGVFAVGLIGSACNGLFSCLIRCTYRGEAGDGQS